MCRNLVLFFSYIACHTVAFLFPVPIQAQEKIKIEKGKISITSDAPLELIKAASTNIKGMIDPATNQFAFIMKVSSFNGFNGGHQQDHFNEKYMESEKYPTATFKGKIIEQVNYSADGSYDVRAKGSLEIHGQSQIRIIKCKLNIKNGRVNIATDFKVPLADHNISIPRIISEKIATEIEVSLVAYN